MKKNIVTIGLLLFSLFAKADARAFFDEADALFSKYVKDGKVKYKAIQQQAKDLENLMDHIANAQTKSMDAKTSKAFYLNAYNLLVIKNVVEHYPIKSPMDVDGFFDKVTFNVAGKQITLNNLEHDIVRPQYKDSRIHFALVCAAMGCPEIPNFAFMPEKVDSQLQTLTKKALDSPKFTRVKNSSNKLLVSEIFKWYKDDFLREADSLLDYINRYRSKKIEKGFKIDYYNYDWALNEAGS